MSEAAYEGPDIYREGAATALGKDIKDVSNVERQSFKIAFFNCMWAYLYGSNALNLEQMKKTIDTFARTLQRPTLDEIKKQILDSLPPEMK